MPFFCKRHNRPDFTSDDRTLFANLLSINSFVKMPWILEEKLFVVNTYLRLRSFVLTQRLFQQKFQTREFPHSKNIYRWVLKFRTSGTILNKKTKRRPLSVRTENNIATVSDSVAESPSTSVH